MAVLPTPPEFGPKLCRDCRFAESGAWDTGLGPRCLHPSIPPDNLATGERPYAKFVRDYAGRCGQQARYFEPRQPQIAPITFVNSFGVAGEFFLPNSSYTLGAYSPEMLHGIKSYRPTIDSRIVVDADGMRVSRREEEMVKKARPPAAPECRMESEPPEDPLLKEFPELAPLPGVKKVGWFTRLRARIYKWVHG